MFVLTEEAERKIDELANAEPPIDVNTPNHLMNAFGVWGGQGTTDEIWPFWSIIACGLVLIFVFSGAFVTWSYALGLLLNLLSSH